MLSFTGHQSTAIPPLVITPEGLNTVFVSPFSSGINTAGPRHTPCRTSFICLHSSVTLSQSQFELRITNRFLCFLEMRRCRERSGEGKKCFNYLWDEYLWWRASTPCILVATRQSSRSRNRREDIGRDRRGRERRERTGGKDKGGTVGRNEGGQEGMKEVRPGKTVGIERQRERDEGGQERREVRQGKRVGRDRNIQ
ncbi:hypothetical protein E2C01_062562 [Portunus trituberculatus]|uniref:Uncharacterized protein n=1 Tax=Portunus trituberculatus TaxID=210409 RepID=A0A5B7HBG6_PORTR|nr:hypothetical protein [Portunus trituberculatus]